MQRKKKLFYKKKNSYVFLLLFLQFKERKTYSDTLECLFMDSMIQSTSQYMHYVKCIFIDSGRNYFMIWILYKSLKSKATYYTKS